MYNMGFTWGYNYNPPKIEWSYNIFAPIRRLSGALLCMTCGNSRGYALHVFLTSVGGWKYPTQPWASVPSYAGAGAIFGGRGMECNWAYVLQGGRISLET